ncbi:hypothetical protein OS31_21430 [Dickeya oryzae]
MLNPDFERYYQRIRTQQKRESLTWALVLAVLYIGAGKLSEFNLNTLWTSFPHFFDYLSETMPVLHWHLLLADGHTEGSLAYWGYRLPIQLPLIWETLNLALAATLFSVAASVVLGFLAAGNTQSPPGGTFYYPGVGGVFAHHAGTGVGSDVCDGLWYRRHPRISGAGVTHHW